MEKITRFRFAAAGLLLLAVGAGCRIVQTAADVPGQAVRTVTPGAKAEPAVDPVEVQQTLMRFADEFAARMAAGVENLRHGTNAPSKAESLRWKLAFGTAACSIASGPNAVANLLDMTVFVAEARMALEEYWQPEIFGASAQLILDSCRTAEEEIWRYVDRVLKPEQRTALREAIKEWHQKNSKPEDLLVVRAVGLALQVAQVTRSDTSKPGSLFSVLMLDPLAELDPTRREIAATRLFAERALFVAQRMPTLLRWQAELLSIEALEQPALAQWSMTATQIAAAADRFARVAEQVPQQISAEREAIIKALEAQEGALRPLLDEARLTLVAGADLSASLNTTLTHFDGVLKRLGVGEDRPEGEPETNAAPFRIQDYGDVAVRLEAAARQLTELLQTFDRTLGANSRSQLAAQLAPVVQQAQAGSKDAVDYAFEKSLILVAAVLLAALTYRVFATLLARAARRKEDVA